MSIEPHAACDLPTLRAFLGGCALANYVLLTLWFVVFRCARGWLRRLHGRWFALDDGTFDAIHYGGMAVYKIVILMFNLVPWAVLSWLARAL